MWKSLQSCARSAARRDTVDDWSNRVRQLREISGPLRWVEIVDNSDDLVVVDHANSLAGIQEWLSGLGRDWVFRGQSTAKWSLATSADRATRREVALQGQQIIEHRVPMLLGNEKEMLEEFQAAAHHHLRRVPRNGKILE